MKNIKVEIKFFSVPNWKKEEKYLQQQHARGWKFVKLNGLGLYHFEKCEPQDVIYQLDYNEDSKNNKDEYVQLFEDCGWEYLQNYAGYSYFRKPASEMNENREEIFCDNASRMDMLKRVFNGRMIPLLVIFFAVIVPQIVMQARNMNTYGAVMLAVFSVMFIAYIAIFASFAKAYWMCRKQVE